MERKANAQVLTRSRSIVPNPTNTGNRGSIGVINDQLTAKSTPEEIKEKMELQLKIQRAAHQQKRQLEHRASPGGTNTQMIKVASGTNQGILLLKINF